MKNSLTSIILNLLVGLCFLTAYPNTTDVSLNPDTHFDELKSTTGNSSVKSVNYIHINDYSERITSQNQNTFTPQYLEKHSNDDAKLNISKYHSLLKHTKHIQYSRNLILNFLSTDIIFPFHTFW